METKDRFPIKIKEVTITSEEYEKTLKYIEELESSLVINHKQMDDANNFLERLFEQIKLINTADDIFNPNNEIYVANNMGVVEVFIRNKQ